MPAPRKRRSRVSAIVALVVVSSLLAAGLAEMLLRLFPPRSGMLGDISYELPDGSPITFDEAVQNGLIVAVPPPRPMDRPRFMFAPKLEFYIRYSDQDVLQRDWLDAKGRVPVRINSFGVREREEITPDKPAGQRRIVCVGDSFTFGWGIPEDLGWVRLLEDDLRADGADVRTVNCGAAGTVCVDEYWYGLRYRFHRFQPDAVVLTICLNDLLPSSGLLVAGPWPATGIRLVDLALGAAGRSPRDLDPTRVWVGDLLHLTRAEAEAAGLVGPDKPWEAMWSQGVPQQCLREAAVWCRARSIPFLVVLWPFLQGLGPHEVYALQKIHDLVAADCAEAGIPFLDVLPALRGTPAAELWVTPADMHPNPRAQQLARPLITGFVRAHLPW
jgi:lysophospholipase L1-like esterase